VNTIPAFEGHPVDGTVIKFASGMDSDDLSDIVVSVDDVVQLISQFKVIGVNHKVDPKTGAIVREQVLKAVEVALCPIDPSNPEDDGILRALPHPSHIRGEVESRD